MPLRLTAAWLRWRRTARAGILLVASLTATGWVFSLNALAVEPGRATSSRQARGEAIRALPLDQLGETDFKRVQHVLDNTTIYRRMPVKQVECSPDLFLFLVRHPEVIVNIWEVMGISRVALSRTGENSFRASDGHGTLGNVEILSDAHDKQLLYAEGSYEGPLFRRPVETQCVILLQMRYHRRANQQPLVSAQLDTFIHVERVGPDLLARTIQPLVGLTADYNFTETLAFVGKLSRATQRNPQGVQQLYRRLKKVDPQIRDQLIHLAAAEQPVPTFEAQRRE